MSIHTPAEVKGRSGIALAGLLVLLISQGTGCLNSSSSKLGDGHDFGENDPDLVLALGDSITAGGFSGGSPWPARFGNIVGKSVINDGIPGAMSSVGAARAPGLISNRRPGFVIIFYGANDAIQSISADATEQSIRAMVTTAQSNQAIPVLGTVMPMTGSRSIYNGQVDRINERIRSIGRSEGVKVVNLNRAIRRGPDRYLVDGLHLNTAGEELVALEFNDAFN